MQRFRVVNADEDPAEIADEIKAEDLANVNRQARELIKLINSPVALMTRAIALLNGTAQPLDFKP